MESKKLMTEKQFIAKFKKQGFELYKTKGIRKVYKDLEKAINRLAK